MSDIPEDIRVTAEIIATCAIYKGATWTEQAIAEALIAERERLAEYATGLIEMAKKGALEDQEDGIVCQFWDGYRSCAKAVVRAIRSDKAG
jgi:hypothetical protein